MQFSKNDLDVIYKYITSKMFGDKLSDYPSVEELTGTELMPIIQNGENKNVQSGNLVTLPQLVAKFTEYSEGIETLNHKLNEKVAWLTKLIENLEVTGMAVMQEFGDSESFGISQKKITAAINQLWEKLEEITGEIYQGINMVVTPDYFISEDGATVHITASTVEANGIFEHIAFYGNGTLISEASNVDYFELDHHINETTIIMCKAKILGVEYSRQHVITHYNSFWIGAGDTYQDIMDVEHVIPITEGLRGSHDVDVPEGKHIIIIMGDTFRSEFMRADISFAEILFNESTVTVDGKNYSVLVSQDTYQAGTYNVFING